MEHQTNPMVELFRSQLNRPLGAGAPPFTAWLGGTLREVEIGKLSLDFTVRHEWTNPIGGLHGGMSAAILDEVIGMTVASLGIPAIHVSINLTVDFLGKAVAGEVITCHAQVIRQGSRLIHVIGEIVKSDGTIIAKATSNLMNISK
ncbi:MAG: PaaI family thioesterase [Bacteroidia bacterium]|nr:PaaI family thioesterase [Bacteroidia bacterium]